MPPRPTQRYRAGDLVIVRHRLDGKIYFSYELDGSIGVVTETKWNSMRDWYSYKLDYLKIVMKDPKYQAVAEDAWFAERCLDPYVSVEEEDGFESVFE